MIQDPATEGEADWARADLEIAGCITERPDEYEPATQAVMADLMAMLRTSGRQAPTIRPGYWPTFQVGWEDAGVDDLWLEVFQDRIEVYHRTESLFDVWDELHAPGQAFSDEFVAAMPMPIDQAGEA